MGINLHELANIPGAGNATKELQKEGHWDEDAGKPVMEWLVEVTGRNTYCVQARSVDEAREKGRESAISDFNEIEEIEVSED